RPLDEAQAEVGHAGQLFRFFAAEVLRQAGNERAPGKGQARAPAARAPVGAVALIAPSQCPFAIPAEQIAPALAFGNTVVFKPAERASACGWALAEVISRAGLPAGVFNLVMGSGRLVGQTLVDSPLMSAVCFAGSAAIGEGVLQRASTRRAKVQLMPLPVWPPLALPQASTAGARQLARRAAEFFTTPVAARAAPVFRA
ncbi:aldehyde dehydrogenase family protein, partial [Ideonella azotifigens]